MCSFQRVENFALEALVRKKEWEKGKTKIILMYVPSQFLQCLYKITLFTKNGHLPVKRDGLVQELSNK